MTQRFAVSSDQPDSRKYILFACVALLLSTALGLVIAECVLRLWFPQDSLSPRWGFSAQFCTLPFPSDRMIHERPGRWRFVYTTNSRGDRGRDVPVSNRYVIPNVVVLGDSYTFGVGVRDGEEYPAVLEKSLAGTASVVNLGVGGWGLTQEIRRYYEFGALYDPNVVVLQFSANDPEDNLKCPVTEFQNGRFEFHDTDERIFRVKRYLSHSFIQRSQLYNSVRDSVYQVFAAKTIARSRRIVELHGDPQSGSVDEGVYINLLRPFVEDLHRRGIHVVFITVDGQLSGFPTIAREVQRLATEGVLDFVDTATWLAGMSGYASPEGHVWGRAAHKVIGMRLADLIQGAISGRRR